MAISYSSSERPRALALAQELRGAGWSVWLDDQTEIAAGLDAIGVPAGRDHWQVISLAFESAHTVVVLDGRAWRSSAYCRQEHAHVASLGKRLAVLAPAEPLDGPPPPATWPVADVADLLARIDEQLDVVQAHTRLVRAASPGQQGTSASLRHLVVDIDAVRMADPSSGVTLAGPLVSFAEASLVRARRRRRLLRRISAAVVVTLLVAAGVSLRARASALDDRDAARRDAARERSLDLVDESARAQTTAEGLDLADRAMAAAPTAEAAANRRALLQRSRSITRIRPTGRAGVGVGLSDDAAQVVVGVGDRSRPYRLVRVEVATGEVTGSIDFEDPGSRPAPGGQNLQVAPDATWVAYLDAGAEHLRTVSFDGAAPVLVAEGASAVAVDAAGRLWWADPSGAIRSRQGPGASTGPFDEIETPGPVTALHVEVTRRGAEVAALHADGSLTRVLVVDGRPSEQRSTALFGSSSPSPAPSAAPAQDRLLRCGANVVAFRSDGSASTAGGAGDDVGRPGPALTALRSDLAAVACVGDDRAALIELEAFPKVVPSGGSYPTDLLPAGFDRVPQVQMASSRSGDHLVITRSDGAVDVVDLRVAGRTYLVADVRRAVGLRDGYVTLSRRGELVLRRGGEVADLAEELDPNAPMVNAGPNRAVVASGDELLAVDGDGRVRRHSVGERIFAVTALDEDRALAVGSSSVILVEGLLGGTSDVQRTDLPAEVGAEVPVSLGVAEDDATVYLTTMAGSLVSLDLSSGRLLHRRALSTSLVPSPLVVAPATSGRGQTVSVYEGDGAIREYGLDLELLGSTLVPGSGAALDLSFDGARLLAANGEGTVVVLDASSRLPVVPPLVNRADPASYRFTPDGQVLGIWPWGTEAQPEDGLDVVDIGP